MGKGTLGTWRFPTSAWVAGLIKPVQSPDAVLETKINRPYLLEPKSQRKRFIIKQPVNFRLTGPICARALNFRISD